jgi:hypothetical protein
MSKLPYKLRPPNEALYLFRDWLLSTMYLPDEIHKKTDIKVDFYILPIADVSYNFKMEWTADIGSFQKHLYDKKCAEIRKKNEKRKYENRLPLPNEEDFMLWQNNQHGVYQDNCTIMNTDKFSYETFSLGERKIIKEHLGKYINSFFETFTDTVVFKELQKIPEKQDNEIAIEHAKKCRELAYRNIPFPGDKQKNIETDFNVIDYSIENKYLPLFTFSLKYKDKDYVYCSDMTATSFTGERPHANYIDEIIMGIVGVGSLLYYFLSDQSKAYEILLLIFGVVGIGYVIFSFIMEISKASIRRNELMHYERDLKN